MTNSLPNLTDLYRPSRFEDVVGQEDAVAYLSGLIRDAKSPGNFLLFGDVGSGKTSLVRIYARALHCPAPNPTTGSPCGKCTHCNQWAISNSNLVEHDTPRASNVAAIAETIRRANVTAEFPQVVFFDEAHALHRSAADYLLKTLEESAVNRSPVAFAFATTNPENLPAALRSRLTRLHVSALDYASSLHLLNRVVTLEGIDAEPGTLEMIARFAGGQVRDLLQTLDTTADRRAKVLKSEHVERNLGYEHVDTLEDYFLALAQGDGRAQTQLFEQWRLPIAEKIRWIQAYFCSFYMRTIRGERFSIDPVVDNLIEKRPLILQHFLMRGGFGDRAELAPTCRDLMRRLSEASVNSSDANLHTAMMLFQDHCNDRPWVVAGTVVRKVCQSPRTAAMVVDAALAGAGHVGVAELRAIYDAASSLIQTDGAYFNLMLEIRPNEAGLVGEAVGLDHIDRTIATVSRMVEALSPEGGRTPFAAIRVAENSPAGPLGYVAMHIPHVGHPDDQHLALMPHIEAWVANAAGITIVETRKKAPADRHWHFVREIARGFQLEDAATESAYRARLGLKLARFATRLATVPVRVWGVATREVDLIGPYPPFSSPLDAEGADLYSNWEIKVYQMLASSRQAAKWLHHHDPRP